MRFNEDVVIGFVCGGVNHWEGGNVCGTRFDFCLQRGFQSLMRSGAFRLLLSLQTLQFGGLKEAVL